MCKRSCSQRPRASCADQPRALNMHRKSGNGIEEGNETKHALNWAHTKAPRCQTQRGEKRRLCSSIASHGREREREKNPTLLFVEPPSKKSGPVLRLLWKVKVREKRAWVWVTPHFNEWHQVFCKRTSIGRKAKENTPCVSLKCNTEMRRRPDEHTRRFILKYRRRQ